MIDRMCAGPLYRDSEFQIVTDPITGTTARQFGLCGPDADSGALSSALDKRVTCQETFTWMRNNGLADPSGASALSGNLACCQAFGAGVAASIPYNANLAWADILAFLRAHAGIDPIVYETSKGQAQVDSITGAGENAVNLQYHFPWVAGYHPGGVSDYPVAAGRTLPEGIWVGDGCSFAYGNSNANGFNAGDVLEFYTMTVIEAAALVGLFALKGRDVMLTIGQVSGYFAVNSDNSWHCKSNGMTIRGGMLQEYLSFVGSGNLNGFSDLGLPLTNEIAVGKTYGNGIQPTIQVFERGALMYDPGLLVDDPPGTPTNTIYKAHINRPEVLAALGASTTPPVPAAPKVVFGAVQEALGTGVITLTLPYTLS